MQEDWETPDALFNLLDSEFDFVLDACASSENAKCKVYFTKDENALVMDWHPYRRIWMNPPYDTRTNHKNLKTWVGKAHGEAQKHCIVVCLLPVSTSTRWWHEYANDGEKRFIKGRVKFVGGKYRAKFDSVVIIFSTWRILVRRALRRLGGSADLPDLYAIIRNGSEFYRNNFVKEKIRQTLQRYPDFSSVSRGRWALS